MSGNIEKIKKIIFGLIEISEPIGKALEDGKIQWLEAPGIGWAAFKNIGLINDFTGAWPELRDLDEAEKNQLVAFVAERFSISKPTAEKRVEAAFKFLLSGAVFFSEWKLAA